MGKIVCLGLEPFIVMGGIAYLNTVLPSDPASKGVNILLSRKME